MRDRQQVGAAVSPASTVACASTPAACPESDDEIEIEIEIDEESMTSMEEL